MSLPSGSPHYRPASSPNVKDFLRNAENGSQGFGIEDTNLTHNPYLSLLGGTFRELVSFFTGGRYKTAE